MRLTVHFISNSMKVLDDVKKSIVKNLVFLIGDHSMQNIRYWFDFQLDPDGDELFELEDDS